ncbi:MAG: GAF domain-containing protein [Spartobacteria bacterium]|nr:GAF domain-containing protein [Spartobacteria bacterium]
MTVDKHIVQLIAEMKRKGHLPALDRNVSALCALINDNETRMADLAAIIMRDAALTSNVLSVANSVAYRPKEPIKTISNAVIFLGFEKIQALALGLAIFRQSYETVRNRELYRLFTCAYVAGTLAMTLVRKTGQGNQEEAFISGLLQQIPRMLLANSFPEQYQDMEKLMQRDACSPNEACRRVFGMNYIEITHAIADYWRLPDSLRTSLRDADGTFGAVQRVVRLCSHIADMLFGNLPAGEKNMQEAEAAMHEIVDDDVSLEVFIIDACVADSNMQRFFNLSYKDIEMMVRIAAWGKVDTAEIATSVTVGNVLREEPRAEEPGALIGHFLSELMMGVQRHAGLNDILMIAQEAIYRCLQPVCVFTAFLDAGRDQLLGRLYAGQSVMLHSHDFKCSLKTGDTLVAEALAAKKPLQAAVGSRSIITNPALITQLKLSFVAVAPICIGTRAVGAYFVGRRVELPFSSEEMRWIEAIAGHVGMTLETTKQ